MPIYEYVCSNCTRRFELIVMGSGRPECPACHGTDLEKTVSVFAVGTGGRAALREPTGSCGTCGDPRGPGSCSMN